jgi:hypothetical protein
MDSRTRLHSFCSSACFYITLAPCSPNPLCLLTSEVILVFLHHHGSEKPEALHGSPPPLGLCVRRRLACGAASLAGQARHCHSLRAAFRRSLACVMLPVPQLLIPIALTTTVVDSSSAHHGEVLDLGESEGDREAARARWRAGESESTRERRWQASVAGFLWLAKIKE